MFKRYAALIALAVSVTVAAPYAQKAAPAAKVTAPKDQFGWAVGDDYRLVNYTQYTEYLKKLQAQSERMIVTDIGKTEEGRTEFTAIITSPENQRKLPMIKAANRRLALAENLTDEQARALARESKVVVWIDGGLHATEVLGAQQLIETIYRLNTKSDPETLRILNDVVILCTLVNPDGMELVSNWYMRDADEKKRSTNGIPRLYQKYIGHDDNRDFYMMNMSESVNANKMMYREWFPAIMYNHHQTGPAGAVLFAPPFRDPFNYNFDPLIPLGIDTVGAAIHTRLAAEGKPGAVMRTGAPYSTWFNGGIRTTSYFHNQIGILTESIGNPTPVEIPFVLDMQLPRADVPNPIAPGIFPFRTAIEVLDHHELRHSRPGVETARGLPLQHVQDGEERHREGHSGQLDGPPEADRGGARSDRGGARRRLAQRREHRSARRARRRVRPRRRPGRDLQQRAARSEDARPARLHPAVGSDRLPHRDEVRQHPDQSRRVRGSRDRAVHRRGQAVSRRLLRRQIGAAVPRPPAGHVRAAGSPGRHPVPGRGAASALRRHRLQPRLLDGDQVRPHSRRVRRSVREDSGSRADAAGQGHGGAQRRGLSAQPRSQRRVRGRQPAVEGERRGLLAQIIRQRKRQDLSGRHHVHPGKGDDAADPAESGGGQGADLRRGRRKADRRLDEAEAGAHRLVGSVRRLDAVRVDPLAVRAVRVPIRGRLSRDARRRQPEREVRRARVRRRRHPRA